MDRKRIAIVTYGCQMNVRDSEVIAGLLKKEGFAITDIPDNADVVILNTCSVRQHAEDKVWSEIGRFKKFIVNSSEFVDKKLRTTDYKLQTKPLIGLVGCMAQNYKQSVFERTPQLDFVVGPSDIHKIPEIVKALLKNNKGQSPKSGDSPLFSRKIWETDGDIRPDKIYHTGFYEDKNHAFVVISEGCSNYCSYCVVPYVRGELHHRNSKDILKEIQGAVDKGITSITLLGQNVNAYVSPVVSHRSPVVSHQSPVNFMALLKMVDRIKGLKEFDFVTSHPKDTGIELFKAMAECEKLKKFLHLPVQSGSDRILKLMNRGYTHKIYLDLIVDYRKIVKGGALTTDIIVGFPTETEADFQDTYNLVKEARFNSAFIFKYSPRLNTAAFRMPDDVPKEIKEKSHGMILELQKKISHKRKTKNEKCKVKV